MPASTHESIADRRSQILRAGMVCFAKCGFHRTSMQDISEEAGISVGLIYRYFTSKEAVISAMTAEHKRELGEVLERARLAPTLLHSLETIFTAHCCEDAPQIHSAFVVDIFAEAGRNPEILALVRDVVETQARGVNDLIARSPEYQDGEQHLKPEQISDLFFAVVRGMLMRDVLEGSQTAPAERRERQLAVVRDLWRLLFEHGNEPALA